MNALLDFTFPCAWKAEILPARPVILPARHFVYPRDVEEVERGALEVLVRTDEPGTSPFLATCALGFRDPVVPTGVWSAPNPQELCAVAGGYTYIIDTSAPERFTMLPYRPVLEVRPVVDQRLLLFVGHRGILAWGVAGEAWETKKLSDEGVTITSIEGGMLRGLGWNLITDKETPFTLDLQSGEQVR
ncbi:MAG TPA: hypothetical protein VK574_14025 [Terracidiphilus sp.]|nr:hypothetical protein [Terracidiphilus sp.]